MSEKLNYYRTGALPLFSNFKMKPIKISEENWLKLSKLKLSLRCKSIDETIGKLFSLVTKFKLSKELENLK